MREFSQSCEDRFTVILKSIFEEAIEKDEIVPYARELIPALHLFSKGLVLNTQILQANRNNFV